MSWGWYFIETEETNPNSTENNVMLVFFLLFSFQPSIEKLLVSDHGNLIRPTRSNNLNNIWISLLWYYLCLIFFKRTSGKSAETTIFYFRFCEDSCSLNSPKDRKDNESIRREHNGCQSFTERCFILGGKSTLLILMRLLITLVSEINYKDLKETGLTTHCC